MILGAAGGSERRGRQEDDHILVGAGHGGSPSGSWTLPRVHDGHRGSSRRQVTGSRPGVGEGRAAPILSHLTGNGPAHYRLVSLAPWSSGQSSASSWPVSAR